jgi:hypothetical protein
MAANGMAQERPASRIVQPFVRRWFLGFAAVPPAPR